MAKLLNLKTIFGVGADGGGNGYGVSANNQQDQQTKCDVYEFANVEGLMSVGRDEVIKRLRYERNRAADGGPDLGKRSQELCEATKLIKRLRLMG